MTKITDDTKRIDYANLTICSVVKIVQKIDEFQNEKS